MTCFCEKLLADVATVAGLVILRKNRCKFPVNLIAFIQL